MDRVKVKYVTTLFYLSTFLPKFHCPFLKGEYCKCHNTRVTKKHVI